MAVSRLCNVIVHARPLFGLSFPNTSLKKLERLASGYFNLCSVCYGCVLSCLGFGHFLAVTLHLLFLLLCACMAASICLKCETDFKTTMHVTVSNGPKCNLYKDKIW